MYGSSVRTRATTSAAMLRHATAPPGGFCVVTTVIRGRSLGDFTVINRDPLDGQDLAAFNQYASSPTQWQQFISLVTGTRVVRTRPLS